MRIIGYARISSREQAENSHALEQQIARLRAAGATEVLLDVESGSRDSRANFIKVMDLVRLNQVHEVICTRLDRLTRSLLTLRKTLDEFKKFGVNLRVLDDAIDLVTVGGKFHANLLGALAEMEVDRLSERVRHGWQHLRDRKVAMHPPFGYIKVNDRHELDHRPFLCLLNGRQEMTKAAIAHEIVKAFLQKRTLRLALRVINERYGIHTFAHHQGKGGRVARELFRFSPGGLRNWLTNPVLQGHTCYLRKRDKKHCNRNDWDIHYHTHPEHRLLTDEEVQQIEEILVHNQRVRGFGTTALKYPLSGLVFCGECRSACYSMKGGRGRNLPGYNYYFQCKNWRLRACSQKSVVRMEVAEQFVIDVLIQHAEAIASIAESPSEIVESLELRELRRQLSQLEAIPGQNPAIELAKTDLRNQIQNFQYQTQQENSVQESNRELLLQVFGDRTYWTTLLPHEKQAIYRALVNRVVVREGRVKTVELKV